MKKLNEKLNKSELSQVRSMIRKEIKSFEREQLEKKLIKIIKKEYKNLNDINEDFDSMVEKIVKTLLQNYHDLLYREKYIIKDKLKLKWQYYSILFFNLHESKKWLIFKTKQYKTMSTM